MNVTEEDVNVVLFDKTNEVLDTAFSDKTVELLDESGKVLAATQIELNLENIVEDFKDKPQDMIKMIEHYIESKNYSPMAIVLALDIVNMEWHVFEGTCNPKAHTFKVIRPITTFKANAGDPKRPPTVAINFCASAAVARGLSVWIP